MSQVVLQLKPIAYRLLLLRVVAWIGVCLVGLGLSFCLLELFEKLFVFKETTAFFFNVLVLATAGLVTLGGLVRVFRNQDRLGDMANRVEQAHPELMDSLNTAVEVARIPPSKRTTIEKLLVDSVNEKTASYHLEKLLIPRYLGFFSLSGIFIFAFILLGFSHFWYRSLSSL